MNDCINWIIDGHVEKECVIKQSPVCAQVTPMAINDKQETDRGGEGVRSMQEYQISKLDIMARDMNSWRAKIHSGLCQWITNSKPWDVSPKKPYTNCNSIMRRDQFLFIQTHFPTRVHVTLYVQIFFPVGLYVVTSSIIRQQRMTLIPVSAAHLIHLSQLSIV